MKKVFCFILVISIFFCCMSSCAKKDDFNEDFLAGYQKGQKDLFVSIWSASAYDEVLTSGKKWKTEDFSIVFTDNNTVDEMGFACTEVEYKITLKTMSIAECYENKNMFFGVYSIDTDNKWEKMLLNDDYYLEAIVWDGIDDKSAKGNIYLYDDGYEFKYLAIIVIINNSIYKAAYNF